MSSATFEALRKTLNAVRRRRSRLYLLYHGSIVLGAILALALVLSLIGVWLEPPRLVTFLLFAAGVVALGVHFVQRLRRMRSDDREMAVYVEESIPDLEQRLLTSLEFSSEEEAAQRQGVSPQFIRQLWQDAETHMQQQQTRVQRVTSTRRPLMAASGALAVVLVTVGAFLLSETLQQSGGRFLWPFAGEPARVATLPQEVDEPAPEVTLSVEPGDQRVRRGGPLDVIATVRGADPSDVQLQTRGAGQGQQEWESRGMERDAAGSDEVVFRHQIPSLREDMRYYVTIEDGTHRSQQYHVTVYDPPRVEQVDVAYDYPDYTGREDEQENDAGDMVVPEGTEVSLLVRFNKPLRDARMQFDDESGHYEDMPLQIDGDTASVDFTVDRDAAYRINGVDTDDLEIENPQDYYIRSIEDEAPSLSLRTPGGDEDVMPLEEVPLEIDASDDYGLSRFTLHYNAVGEEEQSVDFLEDGQPQSASGSHLLALEQMDVQPGDFVSYYVTLEDNNGLDGPQEVISDIYFLQVVSTDREYREAGGGGGQMGGQGGGGGDDSALVSLQKDVIAATWKLRRQQAGMDPQDFSDDVAVVAESQRDATERARMSIDRLSERIDFANDSYANAVEHLRSAIEQMDQAADELDQERINDALQPEQQALQLALRAEAEINRSNVSMQRNTAGGGGGGQRNESENLRELFEMEMGDNQNRYETPEQAGGRDSRQSEEASRLEELAERQEGLTRAQRNLSRRMEDMDEEQRRRELERLRREQEQLTAELEQLSQQMSNQQQASAGQQQSQAGQSQNQQLQRALQEMQEASQAQTPGQAASRGQRAAERLREQQRTMQQQNNDSAGQLAQNLSQRGQDLAERQRQLRQQLQDMEREQGLGQTRQAVRDNEQVQELMREQQSQRSELAEIERMLRALTARAGDEDEELQTRAQRARRSIQPLREQMDNSSRVLDNGMLSMAEDIEGDISEEMGELTRNLQALGGDEQQQQDNPLARNAQEASELREQIEELERQVREYQQQGEESGTSVAEMRQRLTRSRQLSQQLSQQLGGGEAGDREAASRQSGAGQPGDQREAGGRRIAGGIPEEGEAYAWGNARSIQSEITRQSLEDFLSQPELLSELLQPAMELEEALRAQAEQQEIENRLYTASEEDVPEQYRRLVEQYYRALSENGESTEPASSE